MSRSFLGIMRVLSKVRSESTQSRLPLRRARAETSVSKSKLSLRHELEEVTVVIGVWDSQKFDVAASHWSGADSKICNNQRRSLDLSRSEGHRVCV